MRHPLKHLGVKAIVALSFGLGAWTSSEAQQLRWLGTAGYATSYAYGVSADGSVVVGYVTDGTFGTERAFRWTPTTGMRLLPVYGSQFGRAYGYAYGVSANGAVTVGSSSDSQLLRVAVLWSASGDITELTSGSAYGASANGAVVVGTSGLGAGRQAFRWTASRGLEILGALPGHDTSEAYGVSADGSVVVGASWRYVNAKSAFVWTRSAGMQSIGMGIAYAVSANGSVVVGVSDYGGFRWKAAEGMRFIGIEAYGVSADGSVIVGSARGRAYRITSQTGAQDLNEAFAPLLSGGSVLRVARAVSPDGRYIVGWGYNAATGREEGFLLDTIPEPASLLALSAGLVGLLRRRRR